MAAYVLACIGVLIATYLVNTTMITVFYHRGLAHEAVTLGPRMRRFVARFGIWFTGLDPKAWVCMHRRHHKHSDGPNDPHSPVHYGIFGVLLAQLRSYERTLVALDMKNRRYTIFVKDIDFPVNPISRRGLWVIPYLTHLAIGLAIAIPTGMWALGACYFLGMMSHPVEGWLVNSLGHAIGGRNFDTPDNSRNNLLAAWLIVGEGYQNNHHRYPTSAKFSYRPLEVDMGYGICWVLEKFRLLKIRRDTLIPAFGKALPQPPPGARAEAAGMLPADLSPEADSGTPDAAAPAPNAPTPNAPAAAPADPDPA